MKFLICALASLAYLAVAIKAMPQRATFQKLPYYPPPTSPPRPIRVRRQSLGGSLTSNPLGGSDAKLSLSKAIGTPEHNLAGQLFAAGNTLKGPVTTGAGLAYNK